MPEPTNELTPHQEARKAIQEIIAEYGQDLVFWELDPEYKQLCFQEWERLQWDSNLAMCYQTLEDHGFPLALVQVLKDHEQCPHLTPVPQDTAKVGA